MEWHQYEEVQATNLEQHLRWEWQSLFWGMQGSHAWLARGGAARIGGRVRNSGSPENTRYGIEPANSFGAIFPFHFHWPHHFGIG